MAITILGSSPLTGSTGTYPVNSISYDPRLFFTHSSANLYYMIFEKIESTYYLRETGKLSGYNNITNYQYKFDFDKFVNFNNQLEYSDFTKSGQTLQYFGYNNTNISMSYSTDSTLYSDNLIAGKLVVQTNGDVIISGTTITGLTQEGYTSYTFRDTDIITTDYAIQPSTLIPCRSTYYPVITKSGYKVRYTITPDIGSNIVVNLIGSSVTDYTLNLIYVPSNCKTLKIEVLTAISGPYYSYTSSTVCGLNAYYYWTNQGMFDVVYFSATKNIVDTITKESVQLKNKSVILNIKKTKKISQNTGFNLSDTQVREILNSPLIYGIDNNILKPYTLDNDNFTGYNGVNLSGRNIELILTDHKTYDRKTNNTLTFFD